MSNWSGYVVAVLADEASVQIVFKRWEKRRRRWQYFVEPMWVINWAGYDYKPGPLPRRLIA